MKLKTIIITAIVLFFSFIGLFQLKSYGYFENSNDKVGNTSGNIYNQGNSGEDANYIFFSNYDDNGKLYKMDKNTKKRTKLCDDIPKYINVSDEKIYYSNLSDGEKIYSISSNGTERNKIGEFSAEYVRVSGDYIYYSNVDDDNYLYKMKLNGTKNRKILSDYVHLFNIVDNKIYYVKNDSIFSISKNGNFKTRVYRTNKLVDAVSINDDAQFVGNEIYFSNKGYDNKDKFLCKADMSNFKIERLTDENVKDINVYGDYIYYINEFDGESLYTMKTDGSSRKKIKDGPISEINVVGDYIFFFKDIHNEIYSMNMETRSQKKLSNNNPSEAYVYNKNIVYTTDNIKDKRRGNLNVIYPNSNREKMLSYVEDGWQKIVGLENEWVYFIQNTEKEKNLLKKLHRVKIDGGKEEEIISDFQWTDVKVKGEYLYGVNINAGNNFSLVKEKVGSHKEEEILSKIGNDLDPLRQEVNIKINVITDKWIYYSVMYNFKDSKITNELYRCQLTGKDNELISKEKITNLLEYKGNIFYSTNGNLYTMNLDGSQKNKILGEKSDNVYLLDIDNDWIYYKCGKDGNRIYKVKVNGKDKQRVFNNRSSSFIGVDKEYIYFQHDSKPGKQNIIKNNEI